MCEKQKMIFKSCVVIVSLFITASSPQLMRQNDLNTGLDDRWVWGYADVNVTTRNNTDTKKSTSPPKMDKNPLPEICIPYNPTKPDFSGPGKRISEAKCDEYLWQLKTRQERSDRSNKCEEELDRINPKRPKPLNEVGGRDTSLGEFPHMGAVGWQAFAGTYIFKCGSSLISSRFVLTAAHCSRASDRDTTITDPVPKIVRLGDKNIISPFSDGLLVTDSKIISILVHPKYAPPKKYYDIALMMLDYEVYFSRYIQPACLWTKFDTSSLGPTATSTGWGVVETFSKTTSPELQAAVVDVIDNKTCNQLLKTSCNRNWCGVRDDQLCAGKLAGGVDACEGDSGGPLQVQLPIRLEEGTMHYVIGVTSFGIGCGLPNLPGIYTRVSSYLDWIEPIVWP